MSGDGGATLFWSSLKLPETRSGMVLISGRLATWIVNYHAIMETVIIIFTVRKIKSFNNFN